MRLKPLRIFALVLALSATAALAWVVHGAYFSEAGEPSAALRCLGVRCTGDVVACLRDEECGAWLACMRECGDDKMKCPTFCGAYYQSPLANAFTQCALTNQCIQLDFSLLPACGAPDAPAIPLENVDGTWWVAAIKGPDYVLFDDCQRFVLTSLGQTEIRAQNSVPLTRAGQTRICSNDGKLTRTDSGVMQLVYENYVGYHERWHFTHRFENSMLAYVCSASAERSHDYGAFILARVPIADLGTEEQAALKGALRDVYHLELEAMTPLKMVSCPNP